MTQIIRKITKIGKNYGITFPKSILEEADLKHEDEMELEIKKQEIIIRKKTSDKN